MADKDDKSAAGRADAVRSAAVQAFQATAGQAGITRERAQELADDLASAAGRVIGVLEELRPASADDIRSVREEVRALERRIAALEAAAAGTKPAPKAKPTARTTKPKTPKAAS